MTGLLPPEGSDVSYIGPGDLFGSRGRFLASASSYAGHVRWSTGPRVGQIDPIDAEDLVPAPSGRRTASARDELDDSLDVGGFAVSAVRRIQETEGTPGLLGFIASSGHLGGFAGIAEEALAHVAHRVRQDPGIREVTSQLDDDEAESLVQLTAHSLLRDAFGGEDG